METFEGRLASFKLSTSKRKGQSSSASSSSSSPLWPHHPTKFSVTPSTLAHAGFYHDPTPTGDDNVTCIYCEKGLEGWEQGDDALDEHLKRVIDAETGDKCPWATVMGVKRDFDLFGEHELEGGKHDPHAKHLVKARKNTFGEWWVYDGKKSWKPTSDRLARAGFYSNPLPDAPDTCACAYCDTQLAGWAKNDDPEEEHRKRRPDCFFFTAKTSDKSATKTGKELLKASTSGRSKATSRDRLDLDSNIDITMMEDSQPVKGSKLSTSTSNKQKSTSTSNKQKGSKKRSPTANTIAEESTTVVDDVDETIQDAPATETAGDEDVPRQSKAAVKSRKSKAATTTTIKKSTAKNTEGKSMAKAQDVVVDIESDSEPVKKKPPAKAAKGKASTSAKIQDETVVLESENDPVRQTAASKSAKGKIRQTQNNVVDIDSENESKSTKKVTRAKARQQDDNTVIDIPSESEAEFKAPPKTRKRTTRATATTTDASIISIPASPEQSLKKSTTAAASRSKVKSKKNIIADDSIANPAPIVDEPLSEAAPEPITDVETEQSEAERPVRNTRKSKLAKSTSSAETRSTRAKGKKNGKEEVVQSEIESVSGVSEVEDEQQERTIAELSRMQAEKTSSLKSSKSSKSSKSKRSASSKKIMEDTENETEEEEKETSPSQSAAPAAEANKITKSSSSGKNTEEPEVVIPVKQRAVKKAAPPKKATRNKTSTKKVQSISSTHRSTRSGNASDSAAAQSESEFLYASQTDDDEVPEVTTAETTREELELPEVLAIRNANLEIDTMDASTPKAAAKSGKTQQHHQEVDVSEIHEEISRYISNAESMTANSAKPSQEDNHQAGAALQGSEQSKQQPAVPSPPSASMQQPAARNVKALPARKSKEHAVANSAASIFNRFPSHSQSNIMPSSSQLSRGQSALDALLAGPIPTFDSPEKPNPPPLSNQPVVAPTYTPAAPLAPVSPASRQLQSSASINNISVDDKILVKDWIAMLRQRELDRFDEESRKMLVEFDRQTQCKREELAALLRR